MNVQLFIEDDVHGFVDDLKGSSFDDDTEVRAVIGIPRQRYQGRLLRLKFERGDTFIYPSHAFSDMNGNLLGPHKSRLASTMEALFALGLESC
jgi:hypothetical protein